MVNVPRTQDELEALLTEQLAFLQASASAFDTGCLGEPVRLVDAAPIWGRKGTSPHLKVPLPTHQQVAAIANPALRSRCRMHTWQEVASHAPDELAKFLEVKYGI